MFMKFTKVAAAAATLAALPGVAQAGTATASGTATLNVISQCSVTGATVNLGTYTVNNTFQDIANQLGYTASPVSTPTLGTNGYDALVWGKVNCANGTPYQLQIKGTTANSGVKIDIAGKTAHLVPIVKSLGGVNVPQTPGGWDGWGAVSNGPGATYSAAGVGTGVDQEIRGSAPIYFGMSGMTALATDKLAVAGSYTDALTYTLNF